MVVICLSRARSSRILFPSLVLFSSNFLKSSFSIVSNVFSFETRLIFCFALMTISRPLFFKLSFNSNSRLIFSKFFRSFSRFCSVFLVNTNFNSSSVSFRLKISSSFSWNSFWFSPVKSTTCWFKTLFWSG